MKAIQISAKKIPYAEALFWVLMASMYFVLPEHLTLMSQILIMGLFAVSLDMALGYAGILTVGHAAFFGMGAYAAGLWAKHAWNEPFSGLLIAVMVCAALGYLMSYLVVRGADLTRLMITIGLCVLLGETANRLAGVTGGSDGLQGIELAPLFGVFDFDLWGKTSFIYSLAVVLLAFLVVRRILRSPFGLALRGIHDSSKRMQAIGSPVQSRLRMAYCFSAAIAGLAGALMAHSTQFVGIESLSINRSAEVLIILVLGGTGHLYGGLIGAIVYMVVHEKFADMNPEYWMFWIGCFLIAVVMLGGGGLMGALRRMFKVEKQS
ncbi:UNVERIFIED_CONTAM: branched-chain amino acid ABC transporter permease [Comamonas sp. A-3]|uniref:Inner-membrane translocator n=1 Tax=Comamonas testosteroni (strain DSM 14576 / KF-1) TaxID=399795 RepID=B7WTY0_COMTK|nr:MULTISPECIES: branched-chain amino acid ABC transporter permease [Comamonas]EED69251.1 inner-membrane translocator [Comamonas testosteroni KF-1]MDN5502930.1 branched-chain amino acid ABC transporter permease [Comamonas sp.]MDN5536355.1 branched-chain amino acid ABC transporter permease [Comamonas sp.]WQG67233.1 branched-chain amino acid ABC transporter permease [Comamonas testosteroni]